MKSQIPHTVRCNISGEAAEEIWHWSLLGVKGLTYCFVNQWNEISRELQQIWFVIHCVVCLTYCFVNRWYKVLWELQQIWFVIHCVVCLTYCFVNQWYKVLWELQQIWFVIHCVVCLTYCFVNQWYKVLWELQQIWFVIHCVVCLTYCFVNQWYEISRDLVNFICYPTTDPWQMSPSVLRRAGLNSLPALPVRLETKFVCKRRTSTESRWCTPTCASSITRPATPTGYRISAGKGTPWKYVLTSLPLASVRHHALMGRDEISCRAHSVSLVYSLCCNSVELIYQ